MKFKFSRQFFEKYSNMKFNEIRPVRAELLHVDRQTDWRTDMKKLTTTLRTFACKRASEIQVTSTVIFSDIRLQP